ncbi:hypothetical protein [Sinorhizobium meliloti]|uniref:hypothetical protein n=1 Tax=Rhizobium meliloti TaxID=382 RepID=UPI0013E35E4A|nr:hypothetical protein [Sinorhizobium meliloti]MDW9769288.1 hypothetical protein [Sinorhizobium meliloti]MDW9991690.1 hypothetical protein [Sinorhizobium meliloti]MDX0246080.1 hypothetical protein [Sinorhizobium meliloti]MDX0402225.1 hypothetical protein [Sinorhizobium meliloti]
MGHIVDLADLISKLATLPHRGEPVWPIHAEAVAVPVQCDKNGHDVALIHLLRQRER